jgi:hypothetical protein
MAADEGSERGIGRWGYPAEGGQDTVITAPVPSVYRSRRGRPGWRAPLWRRLAAAPAAAAEAATKI